MKWPAQVIDMLYLGMCFFFFILKQTASTSPPHAALLANRAQYTTGPHGHLRHPNGECSDIFTAGLNRGSYICYESVRIYGQFRPDKTTDHTGFG